MVFPDSVNVIVNDWEEPASIVAEVGLISTSISQGVTALTVTDAVSVSV